MKCQTVVLKQLHTFDFCSSLCVCRPQKRRKKKNDKERIGNDKTIMKNAISLSDLQNGKRKIVFTHTHTEIFFANLI